MRNIDPSKIRTEADFKALEQIVMEKMYEASEKSMYQFYRSFWNTHDPSMLHTSWVQECICEHIQAAMNRDIRRLVVNIPPRQGKSTIGLSGVVWNWLQNPQEKYWFLSHSARLYVQNILICRRMMTHPKFKSRWMDKKSPHFKFQFAEDQNTKFKIENSSSGYILGGSPTSTALGMGYTVAVFDDILDSEASVNDIAVQNVNDFYTDTFFNRSNDVNNDVVIILMQRLRENDITGYVNKKYGEQGWFNLVLPAKYDPDRTFVSPIGCNDKRKLANELLDPIRLPETFLLDQAKNPVLYNTRYQQDPQAGGTGNFVQQEWCKLVADVPKKFDNIVIVWDLSFDDEPMASYTVGLVAGIKEGRYYILDMWRNRVDVIGQMQGVREMRKKYPDIQVAMEKRANGAAAKTMLEREIPGIYMIEPSKFGGSKEQRLSSVLPVFHDKGLFIYDPSLVPDTVYKHYTPHETYNPQRIIKELVGFPLTEFKDIVDCVAYALAILSNNEHTTQAMITAGKRLHLDDSDYLDELDRYSGENKDNTHDYGIFEGGILQAANRRDLMDMAW
jgi:phage terminase large subunit-like protein